MARTDDDCAALDLFMEMQEQLAALTAESSSDFISWVLASVIWSNADGARSFARALIGIIELRVLKIELYAALAKSLSSVPSSFDFSRILFNELLHKLFSYHFATINGGIFFFTDRLMAVGVIHGSALVRRIGKFSRTKRNFYRNLNHLLVYFAPEFWEFDRELFDSLSEALAFHPELFILSKTQSLIDKYFGVRAWEWLKSDRSVVSGHDPILSIFLEDDVACLRSLATSPGFSINGRFEPNGLSPFVALDWSPPLVGAAAFLGAVQCFRFLAASGADLDALADGDVTVAQLAAAGGSVEIVRLLQHWGADLRGCCAAAACWLQNDILEWLGDVRPHDIREKLCGGNAALQAAHSNNVRGLRICVGLGIDVTGQDGKGRTPLARAAYCGSLEAVEVLLDVAAVRADWEGASLALCHAAMAGRPAVAELLIRRGGVDPSTMSADGIPVFRAVEQSHLAVTKILLADRRSAATLRTQEPDLFAVAARQYDPRVMAVCLDAFGPGILPRLRRPRNYPSVLLIAVSADASDVLRMLLATDLIATLNEHEIGSVYFVFSLTPLILQLHIGTRIVCGY
jgi:hypothetical protein